MIKALGQIIINPQRAWKHVEDDDILRHYLLPMMVYPLLIVMALSEYIPHWYGFISLADATRNALVTFFKYTACIISTWIILSLISRHYFMAQCSKSRTHTFVGYAFTISMLSVIIGNLLPSDFTFIQFMPMYIIWVAYQGRHFMHIPQDNVFSYTVITSVLLVGMPFAWDKILGIILH